MKQLKPFLISLATLLLLSSCCKRPLPVNYVWTGQPEILDWVPVCIVWYKQLPAWAEGAWRPYKAFSQNDAYDMRKIIKLLWRPEIKEVNSNLKTEDKLSLIFYNGRPGNLIIREVYFEIKDKTFVGPLGKSDKLAAILLKRQEIEPLFYAPYTDLGSHYWDDFERILKNQQEKQKDTEKLKAEREAQMKQKAGEPNQPK